MMTPSSWQGLTRFAVSTGCAVPVVSASLASGVELVGPGPGIRVINFVVDRNLSCARTAETALPDLEGILARCLQFSLRARTVPVQPRRSAVLARRVSGCAAYRRRRRGRHSCQ